MKKDEVLHAGLDNSERSIKSEIVDTDQEKMTKYYKTRKEAEAVRRSGDRIYHKPGYGYYIVRPKQRDPSFNIYF